MANQISKKWPSIMEKRKDTSSTGPITSTASEVSLRFDYQSERTRSNSDSTDNEEIPVVGYPPADDVHVSGDKVSLEEDEGRRTEEMSDKEESTEERRNEKKRLNRNEEGLQEGELEEKLSKKLKTEEVREKEKAVEVQNEANHSDSDATDIALTVMDYTDDFYKDRHNTSNKANSMWCSPEVDSPAANEIRASDSEENENGSSDAIDEEISQPITNSINDITSYVADTDPERPQAPSIMLNIGLEYYVHNWEAGPADTMRIHVVPFGNSSLSGSTDVSSEEGEIGGFPLPGLTNAIESPVSVVSTDQGRSDCVH